MALRLTMLKVDAGNCGFNLALTRWAHISAMPPPLDEYLCHPNASPPLVLPEFDPNPESSSSSSRGSNNFRFRLPRFFFGGSMQLMAVPKKKVSRHKRGVRNGPKALKPTPVIIRCRSCGRVKLPHFYCCSGDRGNTDEQGN